MRAEIRVPTKLYFEDYHYISTIESVLESLDLTSQLEVVELEELEELEGKDYVFEIRKKDEN